MIFVCFSLATLDFYNNFNMKISLNWLKEFVQLPAEATAAEVAAKLTMSTVEVEDVVNQADQFDHMVVGEILHITKHPQADKLQVCQVNIGQDKVIQIVCGATNIKEGFKGIVALPGSSVRWHGQGDLVTLAAAKIREVESFGMICASSEVGLGPCPDSSVLELPVATPAGESVAKALGFVDQILEIENKSMNHRPDLWGHLGLAREVAALYQVNFSEPKVTPLKDWSKKSSGLQVKVENQIDCPRYLGVLIKNVKVEPSPSWLQQRLLAVGSRPINLLVDLTNYLMLETAEPLHAFDAEKLAKKTIVVRRAKKGEKLACLDGQTYDLDESVLVIADSEKPIALAGIMGGADSAISETTTEIVLEAANFEPVLIRRAALKLNNRTEASSRFEKSLDPFLPAQAAARFLTLLKTIQPQIEVIGIVDEFPKPPAELKITTTVEFMQKQIGNNLEAGVMKKILERLGFIVADKKGSWQVAVPASRATKDIKEPIDLVEEVARLYGYDNIQPALPHIDLVLPEQNIFQVKERQTRNWLTLAGGLTEVYNYLFVGHEQLTDLGFNPKEAIEVKNPIAPDQNLLRTSLIPNLIKNLHDNLRWQDDLFLFELDRVFEKTPGEFSVDQSKKEFLSKQHYHLGLARLIKKDQPNDYFKVKGIIEGLLAELQIAFEWVRVESAGPVWAEHQTTLALRNEQGIFGYLGFLKPESQNLLVLGKKDSYTAVLAELDFQSMIKGVSEYKQYQPIGKFPQVVEDLAIVVAENVTWSKVTRVVEQLDPVIKQVQLFDVYHLGNQEKSLAFRLTLQSADKTLTAEEVAQIKTKVMIELAEGFKAKLR